MFVVVVLFVYCSLSYFFVDMSSHTYNTRNASSPPNDQLTSTPAPTPMSVHAPTPTPAPTQTPTPAPTSTPAPNQIHTPAPNQTPTPAPSVTQASGTPHGGQQHWSLGDINYLLQILESHPPICTADWETKAQQYNTDYAVQNGWSSHTEIAICAKFNKLVAGPPTGAGGYSPLQLRARAISQRIFEDQGSQLIHDASDDIDPATSLSLAAEEEWEEDVMLQVEEVGANQPLLSGTFASH